MNKAISVVLLVVGVMLVIFGISAAQSLGSDISRFFTGSPTDKAVWMLIIGAVLCIVGLGGVLRGSKGT
jgi:divalent metal cation (Fe/Co/Zn/Cd) transporter